MACAWRNEGIFLIGFHFSWREGDEMAGFMVLVGMICLAVGAIQLLRQVWFVLHARVAEGEVVGFEQRQAATGPGRPARPFHYPVVAFRTESGQVVEFTHSVGTTWSAYREGQAVPVLYHPRNPKQAIIRSFFAQWGGCLIALVVGVVFLSIGAVLLRSS
jgi:hypothetical protein